MIRKSMRQARKEALARALHNRERRLWPHLTDRERSVLYDITSDIYRRECSRIDEQEV
jgi:FixJ family two-component response regulator